MEVASLAALRPLLEEVLHASRMKGIAVAVSRPGRPAEALVLGTDAAASPITPDSLFPVASVTKLATALCLLRLVDSGTLALDDPLARYLPEAVAAAHPGVTPRRLLSHTSGLPLDLPPEMAPYCPGLDWPALAAACLQIPLERPPLTRVQYSNIGYGLLAIVVERQTGKPFPEALRTLVLDALGIEGYLGSQPPRTPVLLDGIRSPHAKTAMEPFNSPFWRRLALPWGGLLTTPAGALALVRSFLEPPLGFLRPETAAEATRNQADNLPGGFQKPLIWDPSPWGLGPEIRAAKTPHWAPAPPVVSPDSFGHSGASGCVAWADPASGVAWAILGTRTADNGWLLRRAPAIGEAIVELTPLLGGKP